MKFIKRLVPASLAPVVIEAHQWWQNGDHPKDNYQKGVLKEGDLVRRYRTPELDGKSNCKKCGYMMHDHGWIDVSPGDLVVCPGDWIITYTGGETHVCKPDVFEITYEPVKE